MKIEILFFAQLKDAFGTDRKTVEIEEGVTAHEMAQSLFNESGFEKFNKLPVLFAVNERFEEGSIRLKDRDVLALMTPVAGG